MLSYRKATLADVAMLRKWDQEPHVIASDPDDDWEWEKELRHDPEWRDQIIAAFDGTPMGFMEIIDPHLEETHYWGEIELGFRAIDIWIGPKEYLNRGLGTLMMTHAINKCFEEPAVHTVINDPLASNKDAIRFYQRLGFEFVEERWFNDSFCHVHRLTRKRWEENQASRTQTRT